MSPPTSFNNEVSATAECLNNEACASVDYTFEKTLFAKVPRRNVSATEVESITPTINSEDRYIFFAFFNFFPPTAFRTMFGKDRTRVELVCSIRSYFFFENPPPSSYRPLPGISDWLLYSFPWGSPLYTRINKWFQVNSDDAFVNLFKGSAFGFNDIFFWQPIQQLVTDQLFFLSRSNRPERLKILRTCRELWLNPEVIREIVDSLLPGGQAVKSEKTTTNAYLAFHKQMFINMLMQIKGFEKELVSFASDFDAALKVVEMTVKAYNVPLAEILECNKVCNTYYNLWSWAEETLCQSVNFYKFAKANFANTYKLSDVELDMKSNGFDVNQVDWRNLESLDATVNLYEKKESFILMNKRFVIDFEKKENFGCEESKEEEEKTSLVGEIQQFDEYEDLTDSYEKVVNEVDVNDFIANSKLMGNSKIPINELLRKIKNLCDLPIPVEAESSFKSQSEPEGHKYGLLNYEHPKSLEHLDSDINYETYYDISKGPLKKRFIAGCEWYNFSDSHSQDFAEVFDKSCWDAFFQGICNDCKEMGSICKESAKACFTTINDLAKHQKWYTAGLQEALANVLMMKKHNMWILKMLFKTGVKITKEIQQQENMKSSRSEAFKKLLQQHLVDDSKPQESKQKQLVEPQARSTEAPQKEISSLSSLGLACKSAQIEESHNKAAVPVLVNIKWATGSFKCELGHGHTSLRELNGQYTLDVSL